MCTTKLLFWNQFSPGIPSWRKTVLHIGDTCIVTAIQTYAPGLVHVIPDIRSTGHFDKWARVFRTSGWQVQSPWPSQEWDYTINLSFTLNTMPGGCHWNMFYITNYICWQIVWTKYLLILGYAVRHRFSQNIVLARWSVSYLLMYTWHTLLHYPHGANAGCDLAGVAPVAVTLLHQDQWLNRVFMSLLSPLPDHKTASSALDLVECCNVLIVVWIPNRGTVFNDEADPGKVCLLT